MQLLEVKGLCKKYRGFKLDNVSFSIEQGYIMGFIGRNGAGKTTTLKSILGLVHKDEGKAVICGHDFDQDEFYCKSKVSLVFGDVDYYKNQRLSVITDVIKKFYAEWDQIAYENYLKKFDLDPSKKINELSRGMKVKYQLALALSHNARLLLLDEPTSGLDPVSRDELIEIFQRIIEDGEHSILFSTHITSDIEKCADFITYIKDGKIVASKQTDDFLDDYRIIKGSNDVLDDEILNKLIGYKKNSFGFTGLINTEDIDESWCVLIEPADLETVMIYFERESVL